MIKLKRGDIILQSDKVFIVIGHSSDIKLQVSQLGWFRNVMNGYNFSVNSYTYERYYLKGLTHTLTGDPIKLNIKQLNKSVQDSYDKFKEIYLDTNVL